MPLTASQILRCPQHMVLQINSPIPKEIVKERKAANPHIGGAGSSEYLTYKKSIMYYQNS